MCSSSNSAASACNSVQKARCANSCSSSSRVSVGWRTARRILLCCSLRSRRVSRSSSASGASASAAASPSLMKPSSCRAERRSPRKWMAVSGRWCASSMTNAWMSGRISANPSLFKAKSASSRWWLMMVTSASFAFCRACCTKHSSKKAQSRPRQFSAVEVMRASTGASSGISVRATRSPSAVLSKKRSIARRHAFSSAVCGSLSRYWW